jgi:hypothetical protein
VTFNELHGIISRRQLFKTNEISYITDTCLNVINPRKKMFKRLKSVALFLNFLGGGQKKPTTTMGRRRSRWEQYDTERKNREEMEQEAPWGQRERWRGRCSDGGSSLIHSYFMHLSHFMYSSTSFLS